MNELCLIKGSYLNRGTSAGWSVLLSNSSVTSVYIYFMPFVSFSVNFEKHD